MARALAVLVHAFTALLVAGAVALALSPIWIGFKVALCSLLLGIAWQVRPKRLALPDGTVVDRSRAPVLFALLDRIAAETGTTVPSHVIFDGSARATAGYGSGGRYLRVGLPLWLALGAEGRVIVLADQLGRLDARNDSLDPLVLTALQSLSDWRFFFRPTDFWLGANFDGEIAIRHGGLSSRGGTGYTGLAYLILPLVFFPFYALVTGLRRALVALSRRDLADGAEQGRSAAEALSSTAASVLAAARMQAETALVQMETTARRDTKADLWDAVDPVGLVPSPLLDAPDLTRLDAEVRALTVPTRQAIHDAARS